MPIQIQADSGLPTYVPENSGYCQRWISYLRKTYKQFILNAKLEAQPAKVDFKLLFKVALKIEKRDDYYQIFHSRDEYNLKVDELKDMAFAVYWILKYHPFRYTAQPPDGVDVGYLNQNFAVYLIFAVLTAAANTRDVKFVVSDSMRESLWYALCDWDLSRESLMLLIGLLGQTLISQKPKPN
jgi:hypothetical protein